MEFKNEAILNVTEKEILKSIVSNASFDLIHQIINAIGRIPDEFKNIYIESRVKFEGGSRIDTSKITEFKPNKNDIISFLIYETKNKDLKSILENMKVSEIDNYVKENFGSDVYEKMERFKNISIPSLNVSRTVTQRIPLNLFNLDSVVKAEKTIETDTIFDTYEKCHINIIPNFSETHVLRSVTFPVRIDHVLKWLMSTFDYSFNIVNPECDLFGRHKDNNIHVYINNLTIDIYALVSRFIECFMREYSKMEDTERDWNIIFYNNSGYLNRPKERIFSILITFDEITHQIHLGLDVNDGYEY